MGKFKCGHIQFANIPALLDCKATVSVAFCAFFRFLTSSILGRGFFLSSQFLHFQTAKNAQPTEMLAMQATTLQKGENENSEWKDYRVSEEKKDMEDGE